MISFIIPAHNAEKTIKRTISSIEAVSEIEKEIIIIENGSTDRTEEIAFKLAAKFSDVKLLKSEPGVSKARNKGIQNAMGDWLCFVDADDCLVDQVNDIFKKYCDKNFYDLIAFSFKVGEKQKKIVQDELVYDKNQKIHCIANMLEDPTRFMQVWAKLFKRSVIIKNNILFDEELKVAEDSDFTLRFLLCCKSVCLSPSLLYQYSIDSPSTMRTYSGDKLHDYIESMKHTVSSIEMSDLMIRNAMNKYILIHFNIAMVRDVFSGKNTVSFAKKYEIMKEAMKIKVFRDAINLVRIKECFEIRFMPFVFLKIHVPIFAAWLYNIRAYYNVKREGVK